MTTKKVKINRAPVLTLWAAVVAERLGHDREAALTLGKAVAGLNAQSKGRRLGIYEAREGEEKELEQEKQEARRQRAGEPVTVELLGRSVPATRTPEGVRAVEKGQPIAPESVQRYLEKKFGEALDETRAAMQALAADHTPKELEASAFALYEKFRPQIPRGKTGWGTAGELDLGKIRRIGEK